MANIVDLEVMCGKRHMEVSVQFDKPFNGIIFSKVRIKNRRNKDWILKKQTKVYSRFLIEKISEFFFIPLSAFALIMRIMTSPKNFEKIAILKI